VDGSAGTATAIAVGGGTNIGGLVPRREDLEQDRDHLVAREGVAFVGGAQELSEHAVPGHANSGIELP
jgi:hypothetical protein